MQFHVITSQLIQQTKFRSLILNVAIIAAADAYGWHTDDYKSGLILGLHPANERRRYYVTTSLTGCAQA